MKVDSLGEKWTVQNEIKWTTYEVDGSKTKVDGPQKNETGRFSKVMVIKKGWKLIIRFNSGPSTFGALDSTRSPKTVYLEIQLGPSNERFKNYLLEFLLWSSILFILYEEYTWRKLVCVFIGAEFWKGNFEKYLILLQNDFFWCVLRTLDACFLKSWNNCRKSIRSFSVNDP